MLVYTLCNATNIDIAYDDILASTGKSMQEANLGRIQINLNNLCALVLVFTGVSACLFVLWFVVSLCFSFVFHYWGVVCVELSCRLLQRKSMLESRRRSGSKPSRRNKQTSECKAAAPRKQQPDRQTFSTSLLFVAVLLSTFYPHTG